MPEVVHIRAGSMLDIATGRVLSNRLIKVRGGVIDGIVASDRASDSEEGPGESDDGPKIIEIPSHLTVMPGLIDAHLHFFGVPSTDYGEFFLKDEAEKALYSARDAAHLIHAGFTTVRCLGSSVDVALARAVNQGLIAGPRVIPSGPFIMRRGGTWDNHQIPRWVAERMDMFADGAAECRAIVRRRIRDGASVVKIGLSGGELTDALPAWGDDPMKTRVTYTRIEGQTIVEEAHRAGLLVSAHAIGTDAVELALDIGVDTIEHGHGISDELRLRLRESATIVVSTLSQPYSRLRQVSESAVARAQRDAADRHLKELVASMRRGMEMGVKFALGSDSTGPPQSPHSENASEYQLAVELVGLSPLEAMQIGLMKGAEAVGLSGKVGALEKGAFADVIAVEGNPCNDISALRRIRMVMREGQIVGAAEGSAEHV